MKVARIAGGCLLGCFAACQSADPPTALPEARKTPETPVLSSGPLGRPWGRIGYGMLATHYDRDGNGVYEEAQRGNVVYFDRDGDRIEDLIIEAQPPFRRLKWDYDHDGILDHTITSEEGTAHRWIDEGRINETAPRIFLRDRMRRHGKCPIERPKYRFWEAMLDLGQEEEDAGQALEELPVP